MNTTYTQKNDTVQKVANSNAESVKDSSIQNDSLQRKADMANGTAQRFPMSDNFAKHHDGRNKNAAIRLFISYGRFFKYKPKIQNNSSETKIQYNSFLEQNAFNQIDQLEDLNVDCDIVVNNVPVSNYGDDGSRGNAQTNVLIRNNNGDKKYWHIGAINQTRPVNNYDYGKIDEIVQANERRRMLSFFMNYRKYGEER